MTTPRTPGPAPTDAPPAPGDGADEPGRRMRSRWLVHLWLIGTFVGSLATLVLVRGLTLHIVIGLAFVGLAGAHVVQRRRTTSRLLGNLGRVRTWLTRRGRLAWSDLVLTLLTLNLLASGTYDWLSSNKAMVRLRDVGIPLPDIGWHSLSAIVLLGYLSVHVARRRRRLRHSAIR